MNKDMILRELNRDLQYLYKHPDTNRSSLELAEVLLDLYTKIEYNLIDKVIKEENK